MVDVELQRDMDAFLHELKAAPSSPQKHTSQSAAESADDATYFEATPTVLHRTHAHTRARARLSPPRVRCTPSRGDHSTTPPRSAELCAHGTRTQSCSLARSHSKGSTRAQTRVEQYERFTANLTAQV
jgi:hypothetical protein